MKPIAAPLFAAVAIAAVMSAAHAGTVYRCGNAYSQVPCTEAKLVDVGDARTAAQQAEARRVVDTEHRLAAEMRRERLADERMTHGAAAASLSGRAPTKLLVLVTPSHSKKRHALSKALATTDFIAYDPSSRKRRTD